MIKIDNIETWGFKHALRGMRNPMNSWDKSDSVKVGVYKTKYVIGENDLALMKKLYLGGTEHRKYLRQIFVSLDITAPLYWWKEFDTYKVGTVANSCSTMYKIHSKEFSIDDFSHEHLFNETDTEVEYHENPTTCLEHIVCVLNYYRDKFIETKDKKYWWQMIQLLPSSFNQKRTITMNYENVFAMLGHRSNHKLDEWQLFCKKLRELPYIERITE